MTDPHPATDVATTPNAAVTGVNRRTLDTLFRHPLAHNLSWRDVISLFTAIGGAEERHDGEFILRAGTETLVMQKPHHKDLTGPEVMELRHFLTRAGWSPNASAQLDSDTAANGDLIIVIDHAGASIYAVHHAGNEHTVHQDHDDTAHDQRHLLHSLERQKHDQDRAEAYPADETFFEQVADAVATGGGIVIIGHGKGQSNEADHLSHYLQSHHKATYDRIVQKLAADLPHLTVKELLDLGRHAFKDANGERSV